MRRRTPLIAFAVLLAAAAWGWRSGVVDMDDARLDAPGASNVATLVPPSAPPARDPAPSPVPAVAPDAPPSVKPQAAPSFDVVRVEPDGSTVVAGRAEPGEVVTLRNGAETLAETKAGPSGDFVLDLSLPVGEHRLRLADAGNDLSDDAAVVSVPPAGRPKDLLVMMDRPGEPTQILASPSRPQADEPATPAPEAEPRLAATTPVPDPARGEQPSAIPRATLGVEAVEVENRRLSVAGAAPEGSRLNVYLDDKLVGQAGGTADERFIANAMADVSVGQHVVRIDEIGRDGAVIARAEVPFTRPDENSMAAIAPSVPPEAPRSTVPVGPDTDGAAAPSPTASAVSEATVTPSTGAEPAVAASQGPETVIQPALQAAQAKVIIRRGDTLWGISRRAYGQGVRYTVIYLANGDQIRDPDRIYPGQVFRMPDDEGRPPRS
ncbi:LysM peptidoglycan-binding domain-containing protein [Aureimonas sp. AU4]|uniref:LysM peptidoglycan-binding domain-containing protein n=1 Tax=Aureimonas sp. AU4 TaxID=1638163 RepID=UPI000783E98C|nr:LysM peptidoglycan-binding domain-containing protein [Aureimonas sp. AU4]